MLMNDKITVNYYLMTGDAPDPGADTYLGNDVVFQGQDPELNHQLTVNLPPGTYTVYAVAIDRQGNAGPPGNRRQFEVQP